MKWKKPPQTTSGRGLSRQIEADIAELQKHPGEWALVREAAKSPEPARTYRSRGCHAVSHRLSGTRPYRFEIYARWPEDETEDVKGDDAIVDAIAVDPLSGLDCG